MNQKIERFQEEKELDFQEIVFILENSVNACWIYIIYGKENTKEMIIERLKQEIPSIPFYFWKFNESDPSPGTYYINQLTKEQLENHGIGIFCDIQKQCGDAGVKSLDFARENFSSYPHSYVFFVKDNQELGDMARKAGHFWCQKRGVFNFTDEE